MGVTPLRGVRSSSPASVTPALPASDPPAAPGIGWWWVDVAALSMVSVLSMLPRPASLRLGRWLGRMAQYLAGRKNRTIEINLAAGGSTSPATTSRAAWENMGMTVVEMLWSLSRDSKALLQQVKLSQLEVVREAAREGRGVLLVSAHTNNWELVALAAARSGLPVAVVAKTIKTPRLERRLSEFRRRGDVTTLTRERSGTSVAAYRWLRNGGVLGCMMDRAAHGPRVDVPFLGRVTRVPLGPAILARRAGSAVVIASARRMQDGTTEITFRRLETAAHDPEELARSVGRSLEAELVDRPEQWFWIHRRQPRGLGPTKAAELRARTSPGLRRGTTLLACLFAAGIIGSIISRPVMPPDETRYLSVSWEMWQAGQWLVPQLNGMPYSDKPPLMFWLHGLGWSVLGVNTWWPRLLSVLCGLAVLGLTARIARRLWPADSSVASLAPWLLQGSLLWMMCTTMVMADVLLALFVVLGVCGVLRAQRAQPSGWLLLGLAIGMGVLAKGPVVLLHTLPVALLAPLWSDSAGRVSRWSWYRGSLLALLLGSAMGLVWAVPACLAGGPAYANDLLWVQTAHRLTSAFQHARHGLFYFAVLPALLFPWLFWRPVWSSLRRLLRTGVDPGIRFCLAWLVPALILLSLSSGKQPHYLLPLLPAFCLALGRMLSTSDAAPGRWDRLGASAPLAALGLLVMAIAWRVSAGLHVWWISPTTLWVGLGLVGCALLLLAIPAAGDKLHEVSVVATASLAFLLAASVGVQLAGSRFELQGIARHIAQVQAAGRPVGHQGIYRGQYHYLGRLSEPLQETDDLRTWALAHPDGEVVAYSESAPPAGPPFPGFAQPYRGGFVAAWSARAIASPEFESARPRQPQ